MIAYEEAGRFFAFMRAREWIRLRRASGAPPPWTDDPILREYKFTNVKRSHDRTTQQFAEWYGKHADAAPDVQLLNCATARFFGWAPFVIERIGWQDGFKRRQIIDAADEAASKGEKIFTGAYMVRADGTVPKAHSVTDVYLAGLWEAASDIVTSARRARSWQVLINGMRQLYGFGGDGFMAKEVALDTFFTTMWGDETPRDTNTWCPAGPGARRGLNRLTGRALKARIPEAQALSEMLSLFSIRANYWPMDWVTLELHDIQFQLCEFDKYERTRLGEGRPRAKYRAGE